MKKGFTLLELIVVIVIIGILGTLGFTQYGRTIERTRTAEAKMLLGTVRRAQQAYKHEYGGYSSAMGNLAVEVPTTTCTSTHYFTYSSDGTTGTATRCTTGGKTPTAGTAYTITVTYSSGVWGGSAGYYYKSKIL